MKIVTPTFRCIYAQIKTKQLYHVVTRFTFGFYHTP